MANLTAKALQNKLKVMAKKSDAIFYKSFKSLATKVKKRIKSEIGAWGVVSGKTKRSLRKRVSKKPLNFIVDFGNRRGFIARFQDQGTGPTRTGRPAIAGKPVFEPVEKEMTKKVMDDMIKDWIKEYKRTNG